ncbi:MAG: Serine-protein kinase RsbW [Anaerolineales bacterium]|nr:Serine-protein kinase RsbW [Anaerolineales bacterium]
MFRAVYPADFNQLDAIRDFVGEAASQAGFSSQDIYSVQLAADEACSNVIEHAYRDTQDGEIEITCSVQPGEVKIIIHDHGAQFDMGKVKSPNLSDRLEDREIGGLGVYFIHKLMDEVEFISSRTDGNTLTMVKRTSGGT